MKNSPSSSTMAAVLDLTKLARILGVAGSSSQEGEALNALRLADRMIREAGMVWADFIDAAAERDLAKDTAVELQAEVMRLQAEIDSLRRSGNAIEVWQDVGATITDMRQAAMWALDLHRQERVWLSAKEADFLNTCAGWIGQLRPRQQPWFSDLMTRITARTGLQPPV